jgi:hypothetical protein
MGQTASLPDPNAKFQVIGCGNSRTGTTSFGQALEILIGGPVYHGGTQLFLREDAHIQKWVEVMKKTPIRTEEDRTAICQGLKSLISGYTACTDGPIAMFTEEMLEIFPDAKVICTVRDPDKWWDSYKPVIENTGRIFSFPYILALLPTMRHIPQWLVVNTKGRFSELYYAKGHQVPHRGTYDDHIEYVTRVVPKDKLHFYDVKDGWEPLCKILGCEVPDVPFPKANDAAAAEAFFKHQMLRGAMAWAGLGAGVVAVVAAGLKLWRRGS